jgi:hypothetical protein
VRQSDSDALAGGTFGFGPIPRPTLRDGITAYHEPGIAQRLLQAIDDAGFSCSKVTNADYQQSYKGIAMWVATCPASGRWALFVDGHGYAQVRHCSTAAKADLPACAQSSG